MAKIAIDAREISSSTGRYIERLIFYLQEIDNTNEYLILLGPNDYEKWNAKAKNFSKVLCPYEKFSFDEQILFAKQLKELNADLVHFCMPQQPVLYSGNVVTSIHDLTAIRFRNPTKNPLIFWIKQQVLKWVIKRVAKKSKQVITISQFSKKDIVNYTHVKPTKVSVTYPAADEITDPVEPIKNLQSKNFIFYIGRPQLHKNLKRLIEAFAILKQDHPELLLVLAGRRDKLYDTYIDIADKLGVGDSVIFTGFVSDGQLKWLYRACKAYVFPSLSEGFGLPGLEAMVHGAPVVSSTATCLPEIYGDGAWYFNPHDVRDMVRTINDVLTDANLRNRLIRAGRLQAAKYSWHKMAAETLEVYKKAIQA